MSKGWQKFKDCSNKIYPLIHKKLCKCGWNNDITIAPKDKLRCYNCGELVDDETRKKDKFRRRIKQYAISKSDISSTKNNVQLHKTATKI